MRLGRTLTRRFFARDVTVVAPDLIGRVLVSTTEQGPVAVRLTEVEAYAGPLDPASHAYRRTARSEIMYGRAGHLYVYFVYGMHWCANLVTGPDGTASAVLLRAGEVVDGLPLAWARRPGARRERDLARGPAGLAAVLGLTGPDTGLDVCDPAGRLLVRAGDGHPVTVAAGPRVGVSTAADVPWRFVETGNPTVSAYRRGTRATRGSVGTVG
ncbi:DNA-3-methyladenine glycosylase [Nakamurella multipartita]|uniref:Putative 3-methyladenine DNA glycosylase n=1 Tax=Nakamurella multipartita (strain ATCC 700099 / DSM 44233 / CIP 104796 / JCM 9543 / NBRC 105858 / Y-104) TaxID=479431 RepID=C8XIE7_NAKMY|nr:DNA-3-methyladenine glycosylase [Nakamurella multipartita]ACV80412.1 DNA-3-methyladenine glycosylase [Nakamurella multipartita DSM 44233]HOZ57318.1 DNA-3-methyladenine glycosylase [Nakamurella multipartita]